MIVCHCHALSSDVITRTAARLRRGGDRPTPGRIYRSLGLRAECGGCVAIFLETLEAGALR